jgi:hypothetical protein
MKTGKLEEQSQAAGTNELHFMFYFLDRPGATSEVFFGLSREQYRRRHAPPKERKPSTGSC